MSEINEFNTGEVTPHNPWECEDYLCVPCNKAIDDFMAKVEEDKVDEERL